LVEQASVKGTVVQEEEKYEEKVVSYENPLMYLDERNQPASKPSSSSPVDDSKPPQDPALQTDKETIRSIIEELDDITTHS